MEDRDSLLVPVDYSEADVELLRYAVQLAVGLEGEVVVLHVVTPEVAVAPAYVGPMMGYDLSNGALIQDAQGYLEKLQPLLAGVPHRLLIRTGSPGTEILAAAIEERATLIVMATHGRNALSHMLMGSTTEAVLRQSPVPVVAVRTAILSHLMPAAGLSAG